MNHMNGGADQTMWFMLGACRRQSHRDFSFLFFHSISFYSIYNLNIIKSIFYPCAILFCSNAEAKLVKMRYTDFLVSGLPQECETICFDAFTHEWDDLQDSVNYTRCFLIRPVHL